MNENTDLKDRRKALGVPRIVLALAVGVTERTLTRWEQGDTTPSDDMFDRWEVQVALLERRVG